MTHSCESELSREHYKQTVGSHHLLWFIPFFFFFFPLPGADHHPVHRLSRPDLFILLCLLSGEGCCGRGGQDWLLQLRRCPVVGRGKAAETENRNTLCTRSESLPVFAILRKGPKCSYFVTHYTYITWFLDCHSNFPTLLTYLKGHITCE